MDWVELDQEFEHCKKTLAARLNIKELPDAVWGYVIRLGLVFDAIREGEYKELEKEARERLEKLREETPTLHRGPTRDDRIVMQEVQVGLSDQVRKRSQVFEEVAATLAANYPDVQHYRKTYLSGRLLTRDEAGAFLDKGGSAIEELSRVARKLARAYRWREGDAAWFVLAGDIPPVQPVSVTVSQTESIQDFHPNTTRITVTADVWVPAEEIESVYRGVQRQILGGDCKPKRDRTLDAVRFVSREIRQRGVQESWEKLRIRWNQENPTRQYNSRSTLFQAFERFIHPEYNPVRWKPYKPTPYQEWEEKKRREAFERAKAIGPPKASRRQ